MKQKELATNHPSNSLLETILRTETNVNTHRFLRSAGQKLVEASSANDSGVRQISMRTKWVPHLFMVPLFRGVSNPNGTHNFQMPEEHIGLYVLVELFGRG